MARDEAGGQPMGIGGVGGEAHGDEPRIGCLGVWLYVQGEEEGVWEAGVCYRAQADGRCEGVGWEGGGQQAIE